MDWLRKLSKIDRRIIFTVVMVAIAIPIFVPLNLPVFITKEVRGVYDEIEKLPAGSAVMLVFDYEPAATPELDPMTVAILRQCFRKNLRVITTTLYTSGSGIAEKWLTIIGKEYGKVAGKDYVHLGYKSGVYAVVIGLGVDLKQTFPKDYYGNNTYTLEGLKDINSLKDIKYLVVLHDDATVFTWITYGYERYGIRIGTGCTAVMAPGNYPALNAGQITGIIGGLKGASEYEKLEGYRGAGSAGMDSQSVIHIFIIGLIVFGNITYFTLRRKQK
ncbi:MAG: hypothetical protein N3A72_04340 [bacterium]|nr:hypothetical protein [bacterium]